MRKIMKHLVKNLYVYIILLSMLLYYILCTDRSERKRD